MKQNRNIELWYQNTEVPGDTVTGSNHIILGASGMDNERLTIPTILDNIDCINDKLLHGQMKLTFLDDQLVYFPDHYLVKLMNESWEDNFVVRAHPVSYRQSNGRAITMLPCVMDMDENKINKKLSEVGFNIYKGDLLHNFMGTDNS